MRILTGEKILLRPVEREDLRKRVEWINDEEVQATLNYPTPVSFGGMSKWYDKSLSDNSRWDFSVYTKEGDLYIGFAGFLNLQVPVMKAELYAAIGNKEYWSGGYGTDVYRVLMNFGFQELGLNRIYGYQLVHNYAAHRVIEKLGWSREGLLRQDLYSHGTVKDRYLVSVLRSDWATNEK